MRTPSKMPGARGISDAGTSFGNDASVSSKLRAPVQANDETEEQVQDTFLNLPTLSDDRFPPLPIHEVQS